VCEMGQKSKEKQEKKGRIRVIGSTLWKFGKPNETMLVIFGAFVVLAVIAGIQMARGSQEKAFAGKVKYDMKPSVEQRMVSSIPEDARIGENDSSLRYAERVKEASSIGLGLSLFLIRERVSHGRVLPISQVMSEFSRNELLPPGVEVVSAPAMADYGVAKTLRGMYVIRYSAKPLALEVLGTGWNGLSDGAVFVVRAPDTNAGSQNPGGIYGPKVSSAGGWATLFEAPENEGHSIPAAFAPVQTYQAMNWQVKSLTQVDISPEKLEQLNSFLNAQR
jgi:hypothetical protein